MLCQDNEDTIGDSIGRIRPYVDEVVVLDLESSDRSTQIALEYDARVYRGRFVDDLSSLRNAIIGRATSDWILVLDADELIDEEDALKILERMNSASDEDLGMQIRVRVGGRRARPDFADSEVRLFRNRNDILFAFRACEHVSDSIVRASGRIIETDIEIRREDDCNGSQSAYRSLQTLLRLLHLDLADTPNRVNALFNLGRLHFRVGNFFNAECFLNDCLQQLHPSDMHYRNTALWLIESHLKKADPYRAREVGAFVQKQVTDDSQLLSNISALLEATGELP